MKTYSKAPDEVAERAASLIDKYHPDLKLVGIKIDFVTVATDDEDGDSPLKHHGYPAYAVVKIVGPKERALGRGDAEILIDEAAYHEMDSKKQNALLDHELYHLEIVRNKKGKPKHDAQDRPVLKMRLHDRSYGWFDEIAKRHGSASIECQQSTTLFLSGKQTYFNFDLNAELGDGVKATVRLVR